MTKARTFPNIKTRDLSLCVGLDTDVSKIRQYLLKIAMIRFSSLISKLSMLLLIFALLISRTWLFMRALVRRMDALERTVEYIHSLSRSIYHRRCQAGRYRKHFCDVCTHIFREHGFDAVTVAPYMGKDSVSPFLTYENKWVIVLALTSNKGFRFPIHEENGEKLFEKVLKTSKAWERMKI